MIAQTIIYIIFVWIQRKYKLEIISSVDYIRFIVMAPHLLGNFLGDRKYPNFIFISLILLWIFCIDLISPITNMIIKVVSFEFFALITMPIMIQNLSKLKSHDYRPFAIVYGISYAGGCYIYYLSDYKFRVYFQFFLYQLVTVLSYLQYLFGQDRVFNQIQLNTINNHKGKTDKLLYLGKVQGRHLVMTKKSNLMIFDMWTGQKLFQNAPYNIQRKRQILHLFKDDLRQILIYISHEESQKYKLYILALKGFKNINCLVIDDDLSQKHIEYDSHSMSILYLSEFYDEDLNLQRFCLSKFCILNSKKSTSSYLNIEKLQIQKYTQFIFYNENKLIVKYNYIPYADKLELFNVDFSGQDKQYQEIQQISMNEYNKTQELEEEQQFYKKDNCFQFISDEIQEFFYYKQSILVSSSLNLHLLDCNSLEIKYKINIFHLFATAYPLTNDCFIVNKNDDYYICDISEQEEKKQNQQKEQHFKIPQWNSNNKYKINIKSHFKIPGGQNHLHISKIQNSKHIMLATKKLIINIIDFDPTRK